MNFIYLEAPFYLIQSLRLLQIEPLFTLFRGSVLEVSYTLSYSYTSNS